MLVCRETKQDYLYMMDDKVKRALRLVNMGISESFCKLWLDFVISNLEWNNRERNMIRNLVSDEYGDYIDNSTKVIRREELQRDFEKEKKNERHDIPYLMPHEFLFLLCNTHNLLGLIEKAHRPDLSSKKGKIYQWEISDNQPMSVMREKNQVLQIHLLKEDAFKNKAPAKLLAQSLAIEQDCINKKVKREGMEPVKIHERPRTEDRGHDQAGRSGEGGPSKSSYNRAPMTRSKKSSLQHQQSQGGAKQLDEKKREADVKRDFGAGYKGMMGQHWGEIEENMQGTSPSRKKRHANRISKLSRSLRVHVDTQDDVLDSLKQTKNAESSKKALGEAAPVAQ